MSKSFFIFILVIFCIKVDQVSAQMQNSSYILDVEAKPEAKQPAKPSLENQGLSNLPSMIKGNGFTAKLSKLSQNEAQAFTFSTSDSSLDFGEIKPGDPIIRTQIISVTPGTANGFEVFAFESNPLRSTNKHEIPNTSCDSGNCTNTLFDTWESPLTYGFGYRCQNIEAKTCPAGINNLEYKRFSNQEANELPSLILSSTSGTKAKSQIEYKINIPGNQPRDAYKTTIHLIAAPSL